jgi:hypothetical protein
MADTQNLSGRGRKPGRVEGDSFRHRVARRIRDRRLDLQMRAEDAAAGVATILGHPVNVQTWYHWERAEHPFDIDALEAIASVLGCAPHDLLPQRNTTMEKRDG